jgi:hypothetical protein
VLVHFITYIIFCYFLLIGNKANTEIHEISVDKSFFSSPVHHPIKLAGSFGELRNSHYHSGIDIKTSEGVEGDPILAAADGIIHRMSIQSDGYGKSLFINHANKVSSVYGHLNRFHGKIEDKSKQLQGHFKSYIYNFEPQDSTFSVKKGDTIGYMGNTGGSQAPHLHFELRETETNTALNPLAWGFLINDTVPPVIGGLTIFETLAPRVDWRDTVYRCEYIDHKPVIRGDTILVSGEKFYFGIRTIDYMTDNWNKPGIYGYRIFKDGKLIFSMKMDRIPMIYNRAIHYQCKFQPWMLYGDEWYLCMTLDTDPLKLNFDESLSNGIFNFEKEDSTMNFRIEVFDFNGNSTDLTFVAKKNKVPLNPFLMPWNASIDLNRNYQFTENGHRFFIPKNTFLESNCIFISSPDTLPHEFYWDIHGANPQLFNPIYYSSPTLPKAQINKYCLALIKNDQAFKVPLALNGNNITSQLIRKGLYRLTLDTLPPILACWRIANYNGDSFKFSVHDNFSYDPYFKDPMTFQAMIDGEWTLVEYDRKFNLLTIKIESLNSGPHQLYLCAEDEHCNEVEYHTFFNI